MVAGPKIAVSARHDPFFESDYRKHNSNPDGGSEIHYYDTANAYMSMKVAGQYYTDDLIAIQYCEMPRT